MASLSETVFVTALVMTVAVTMTVTVTVAVTVRGSLIFTLIQGFPDVDGGQLPGLSVSFVQMLMSVSIEPALLELACSSLELQHHSNPLGGKDDGTP